MRQFFFVSLVIASVCWGLSAGPLRPQQLLRIPSGSGQQVSDLKIDSHGNLIVAASVASPASADGTVADNAVASFGLIKKIDPQGNELFSRFLPGASQLKLAVDQNGDIYVGGVVFGEFLFTSILYTPSNGGPPGAGFLAKFRGTDGTLVYAAELGGVPTSILIDSNGQALFAMTAWASLHVPVTPGAYSHGDGGSLAMLMYVVRLSAGGDRVLLSALYSGSSQVCITPSQCFIINAVTSGSQIMLDGQGNIWIAGITDTTDLPVTPNALKSACGCSEYSGDGFLAELSNDGSKLLYATYLGTTPSGSLAGDAQDIITSAIIDSGGHIWMAGQTNGKDFPVTPNAIQQQVAGGNDGFIAEYDPAANKLLYATYFGGEADDTITNVQLASDGTLLFAGHSNSTALPIAASGFKRGPDFLATLDPITFTIDYLTTFANGSVGVSLVTAPQGVVVISGTSDIASFLKPGTPADGTPSLYAVTNSANFVTSGQVAPGELITLFGSGIGSTTPFSADLSSGLAPQQLGGVQVIVDGTASPLLYVASDQINAIVPFDLSANSQSPFTHTVSVTNSGVNSNPAILDLVAVDSQPFSNTAPFAAALNQDGTVNSEANPAAGGSVVSVFGTGFGEYAGPAPPNGSVVTTTLALQQIVQVLSEVGPVDVLYAGAAPTLVAGVAQVNFQVPTIPGASKEEFVFDVGGVFGSVFDVWVK
jgi:uncharacterized protein (TIGR03437 family)